MHAVHHPLRQKNLSSSERTKTSSQTLALLLSLSLFFGEATQTDDSLSQSVRVFQRRVFFVTTGAVFSFELLKSGSKNRISTHNATKSERGNDNITNERHKKNHLYHQYSTTHHELVSSRGRFCCQSAVVHRSREESKETTTGVKKKTAILCERIGKKKTCHFDNTGGPLSLSY